MTGAKPVTTSDSGAVIDLGSAASPSPSCQAVRIDIATGYTEGQWIEVRGGLEEGDAVIVAGKSAVREGSPVQVLGAETAKPAKAAGEAKAAAPAAGGTKQAR